MRTQNDVVTSTKITVGISCQYDSSTSCSIYVIHEKVYTSLVLLGSTTASQRALAAAQAAELGGKEKALTGFRGFLVTACGIHRVDVWYLKV